MDVRRFIYGLVGYFPGPLQAPARKVADVVFGAWDDVSAVFRLTVPFWRRWFDAATGFANNLVSAVVEAALTARWLVGQWIPTFVRTLVSEARDWLVARLVEVRWLLQGLIDGVSRWVSERLDAVSAFIRGVRDWALERLNEIWNTLNAVIRIVNTLLTDPNRLAQWAAGAMFWALLRVVDGLIEPIVDYLWERRQSVILKTMSRLESIIARLL